MPKSKPIKILAIETSCDETAAAVIEKTDSDLEIISNVVTSQIEIHKKYGGVFPEHASRAHVEKIIPVVEEALGNIDPDIIAVTIGPGLIGSLLVGINFAKTLAFAQKKLIIGVNHWLGHIYSNWAEKPYPIFPALILIVSGGHTGLVLMESPNDIEPLGETLDDAAGEAFDKVAKLLNLSYPGGPAISKAAKKGNPKTYNFPRSMLDQKNYNFSFSGLKTAILYETKKLQKMSLKNKADFAASFQQAVIDILIGKTIQAAYEFKPKSICICGGVSANKELREQMKKAVAKLPWKTSYHVPPIKLSTDNAAMIGIAAAYYLDDATTHDKISADSNLKL
jgi:N6-L-threonylcarbamoyladenine synthase